MPEQTTAPPTEQDKQSEAHEAAERLVRGDADMSPEARAQFEVAQANKALVVQRSDWTLPARHAIDAAQMEVLRATVAKDCNHLELAMFLEVSARYGLDPFLKEVFAAKFDGSGGVTIFTGRDGLLKAARNTGRFVRMISAVVRENDTFMVETRLGDEGFEELPAGDPSEGASFGSGITRMTHKRTGMGDSRGAIIGAWALVWKAGDPEPYYAEAPWSEHGAHRQKDNSNRDTTWTVGSKKGFPEQMMRKVAESIALRMTFGITGIVGAEELGDAPERVQNLSDPGGASGAARQALVVEYGEDDLGRELRELVEVVNSLLPGSWRPAKIAMKINGQATEKRVELRDTLRRVIVGRGEPGKAALAKIAKADDGVSEAEVVEEAASSTQEPAEATERVEATGGTPGGAEGAVEDADVSGDAEPEPEPEALEGSAEELPAYDRHVHSALVDEVSELRGVIEGMAGEEPTLELEEARAEAQAELDDKLKLLAAMNDAAEAAGQPRVDA